MQVQIGAHEIALKAPASFMVRREVAMAVQKNALRGLCAALGVCWGGKPLRTKYEYDALAYGGQVFDELMGLGLPEGDIYAAGGKALELCVEAPSEAGVTRAEGFTQPQTEGSTP